MAKDSITKYQTVTVKIDSRALTRLGPLVDKFRELDRQGNRTTEIISVARNVIELIDGHLPIGWSDYNKKTSETFGPDDADKGTI